MSDCESQPERASIRVVLVPQKPAPRHVVRVVNISPEPPRIRYATP